ncbi:hypothetical protein Tco_1142907 [Tanacetum coccineum]
MHKIYPRRILVPLGLNVEEFEIVEVMRWNVREIRILEKIKIHGKIGVCIMFVVEKKFRFEIVVVEVVAIIGIDQGNREVLSPGRLVTRVGNVLGRLVGRFSWSAGSVQCGALFCEVMRLMNYGRAWWGSVGGLRIIFGTPRTLVRYGSNSDWLWYPTFTLHLISGVHHRDEPPIVARLHSRNEERGAGDTIRRHIVIPWGMEWGGRVGCRGHLGCTGAGGEHGVACGGGGVPVAVPPSCSQ